MTGLSVQFHLKAINQTFWIRTICASNNILLQTLNYCNSNSKDLLYTNGTSKTATTSSKPKTLLLSKNRQWTTTLPKDPFLSNRSGTKACVLSNTIRSHQVPKTTFNIKGIILMLRKVSRNSNSNKINSLGKTRRLFLGISSLIRIFLGYRLRIRLCLHLFLRAISRGETGSLLHRYKREISHKLLEIKFNQETSAKENHRLMLVIRR